VEVVGDILETDADFRLGQQRRGTPTGVAAMCAPISPSLPTTAWRVGQNRIYQREMPQMMISTHGLPRGGLAVLQAITWEL